MPRGDGTGPFGQGPRTGRGLGRGGRAMGGGRAGAGPVGRCVCPQCGERLPHQAGISCADQTCPKCGVSMMRE